MSRPSSIGYATLALLLGFLRPLAIATAVFTSVYFVMAARFGYGSPIILVFSLIIGACLAVPYGVAGILVQLSSWLVPGYSAPLRCFLSPFLYGGITGAYILIFNTNPRMFSYHEQPFNMPSSSALLQEGLSMGVFFGSIGISMYFLTKLVQKAIRSKSNEPKAQP